MPSANRGAFQYGCLSFHCHPIVLTGTSSTVRNRSRIKDILVLFLTAFPLKNDFYHGSFINVLLCGVNSLLFQVRYVVLWWIGPEFFPMLSLHLLRWVCFSLPSINLVYYIHWCLYVEPTLHSWVKCHLVLVQNLLTCLLIQFTSVLKRMFMLIFIRDIILSFMIYFLILLSR